MRLFFQKFRTTLVIFLTLGIFTESVLPVLALPSASSIAATLERRYHLNLGSIRNQGENFNVSDTKKQAPEMSLFFSPSDPKEGEKISAKAFPIYFSNPGESLYYTWYLEREGCKRNNFPSDDTKVQCDRDNDGKITIEDWKIEAAKMIAQNGYDSATAIPEEKYDSDSVDSDDDGYKAKLGGDHKENTSHDYCYVHDADSGINYELVENSSETSFSCPTGTSPVCMVVEADDITKCSISGLPTCSSNAPFCNEGSPYCVADPETVTTCAAASALTSCSTSTSSGSNAICEHLFPRVPASGDGTFGLSEEEFWGTDPKDPDTADNGNKDEANVVGLGRQTFTWNYGVGDMVGVAIEGTSMIPTKHDNSSFMIMWAFSKNDCPVSGKGSYTENIKGYNVEIPTAALDLNDCIEKNIVDPTQGGQATNLEVGVSSIPDNPVNDETTDKAGDIVIAQASVSNAQRQLTDTLFDWTVEISSSINFSEKKDITKILQDNGLLGNTKGNALDSIKVKLDMSDKLKDPDDRTKLFTTFESYLTNGTGYLRFKVKANENFASGASRSGRSDVIVKFTSSGKKITAYRVDPIDGTRMKVALSADSICNQDALDRAVCRIIKNEVIGLKIDKSGLSNFHWTINGAPLVCSRKYVSEECSDPGDTMQNEVNFFPVTGNVGDTYTVVVTANDTLTGNTITLSRVFNIVQPLVSIKSLDERIVWPKLLGQYRNVASGTDCPGGLCDDKSASIFQADSGSQSGFQAVFVPSFLKDKETTRREWRVDGEIVDESAPGEITFTANKFPGEIYNVGLLAQVSQSQETRRALLDIWDVSPFESTEINLSSAIQVELKTQDIAQGPLQGERKYLAALVSYIPASLLFTFRILLSAALSLFAASFLYRLLSREINA